jgi:hypothetical protein
MRRRTVVVAGCAAAVVLVGAVSVVGLTRREETIHVVAPVSTAPATVASGCGLPGTPEGTGGAVAATWTTVAGWPLPTSAADCPGRRSEHAGWSCYTHTLSGAVMAAYVIPIEVGLADDRQAVIRQQTMPGPGQDVLLGSVANEQSVVTPRGFDVAAYSPQAATVRYRLSTVEGEFTCTTDVRWSDGDWRLVLGDDGSTSSGCVRGVPDEFTPWGP